MASGNEMRADDAIGSRSRLIVIWSKDKVLSYIPEMGKDISCGSSALIAVEKMQPNQFKAGLVQPSPTGEMYVVEDVLV
jgi:hypothetical protein